MGIFKKYAYWSAVGLFTYMPFHIFISQWASTFTGGLDGWKIAKDVFTAVLVSALVLAVLITRKYTRPYLYFLAFSIVFLILHLILLHGTNQPLDTGYLATTYNNRVVWYLLIGYSLVLLAPKIANARYFARLLIIVSTLVCLIGLAQWVLPKDLMTNFGYQIERGVKPNFFIDDKPDLPRVFSTIRDPNSLGAFLILPIIILTGALVRLWNTKRRMLLGGLLLLHLLILSLTFSRSAFLGTILAGAVLLALRYGGGLRKYAARFWLPLAIVPLIAAGSLFLLRDTYLVQNVIFHADESTVLDDPNELRVQLFQKGVDGIAENPEGNGPGTAGLVSTKLPNGLLTENYYLQIGYEVGILGLLLFAAFLAYLFKLLWDRRRNLTVQALLASFVGLAFMNLLLHSWANEAVAASWFMLAGLMLTSSSKQSKIIAK